MFLLLILILGIFIYLFWVLSRKVQPSLILPTQHHFESVVPTGRDLGDEGEEEEEPLNLRYGYAEANFEDEWEETKPVRVEDEDTVLLMEAERIMTAVEEISKQKIDVYAKLVALLDGHIMFNNTPYKDALTRYIALVIKEECDLEMTESELDALWI